MDSFEFCSIYFSYIHARNSRFEVHTMSVEHVWEFNLLSSLVRTIQISMTILKQQNVAFFPGGGH